MNKCPKEEKIEHYLLGSVSENQRLQIESHLYKCAKCQEILSELEAYYEILSKEMQKPIPVWLRERVEQTISPKRLSFVLRPILYKEEFGDDRQATYLLAARTRQEPEGKLAHLTTLSSENDEIILRMMRDNLTGNTVLFVISESPEYYQNVLLKLSGVDQEFMTDANGRADLGNTELPDLPELKISVTVADDVFKLTALDSKIHKKDRPQEFILTGPSGDRLKFTLKQKDHATLLQIQILEIGGKAEYGALMIAVNRKGGEYELSQVSEGTALFQGFSKDDELEVRIFKLSGGYEI